MIVNGANLRMLGVGFSTAFKRGVSRNPNPQYRRIAMVVPSATAANQYGWLGDMPRIREWIGDRVIKSIRTHGYTIENRDFEFTLGVKRTNIEDDNVGIYSPLFEELGQQTAEFPDEMVWPAFKAGFSTPCYDKQFMFDTDHPVLDENGVEYSVSNFGGGSGTPWFLVDDTRVVKPMVWQERKQFGWVSKDREEDDNVFMRKEFLYGTDGRFNVGYGFWQLVYASKQPLTPENYEAARVAMRSMKGDYGRPLNLKPNLLVVPPSLEGAAKEILENERNSAGATNKWRNTAELLDVSWLS